MSLVRDVGNVVTTPVEDALLVIWKLIFVLLGSITFMWVMNLIGDRFFGIPTLINLVIALGGTVLIAMVGFRSTNLVGFGIAGAFISLLEDRDKSQGAAQGLYVLVDLVVALGFAWVLCAFTLLAIQFGHSPMTFWIFLFGAMVILTMQQVYNIKTRWAPKLIGTYAVIMMIIYAWGLVGGAYAGKVFDHKTGEALYMVDPITGSIDTKRRDSSDCRPRSTPHVNDEGHVFNYAVDGTCFSTLTGNRLVPMTSEGAINRSPIELIKKATRDLSASSSRTTSSSALDEPSNCSGKYAKFAGCREVVLSSTIGMKTGFVPQGYCPIIDNNERAIWKPVRDREWEVYSTVPSLKTHFYILSKGQTYGTYSCPA